MAELPSDEEQLRQLREAIARLFKNFRDLEARLAHLESAAAEPLSEKEEPAGVSPIQPPEHEPVMAELVSQPATPPESPFQPSFEKPPLAGEPGSAPGAARPWQFEPPSFSLSKLKNDRQLTWEGLVGGHLMTWVGAFTIILAIGFAIQWLVTIYTPPAWLQVTAFHLLGLALLAAGHILRRRELKVLAHALAGVGVFTLYAIAYAALHHYEVYPAPVAFAECAAISFLAIALALREQSVAIVLVGALGGYLTPILTSTGTHDYVALFTYLAFLNIALIGCAVLRGWTFLKPLTWAATAAMFWWWVKDDAFHNYFDEKLWNTEWLLVLHWIIFLVGTTLPPFAWRRRSTQFDLLALTSSSLWFLGMTWYLFHERTDQQLAAVSWGLAALHLALFGIAYTRLSNVDPMPRVHLALSAIFFTLAAPLQLDDATYLSVAWCTEGLIFALIAVYFRDRQMHVSALIVFALALVRLFRWEFWAAPQAIADTSIDLRFALFTICALTAIAAGSMYYLLPRVLRRDDALPDFERNGAGALIAVGNLVLLIGMVLEWDSRLVLVLWTLEVAVVAAFGFWRDLVMVRWYAAGLALVMVGGRALYHFDAVDTPFHLVTNTRFVSLAAVAALYFGLGWFYRRLRLAGTAELRPTDDRRTIGFEDEGQLDPLFGILANAVLLAAITCEIQSWFAQAARLPVAPFPNMEMAEQATYSVAWAIYAALVVLAGFLLRYRLFRILGLLGFVPILAKVFLVDLAHLRLFPRVLALAVLGLMLLAVSFLYQKFTARVEQN